MADAGWGAAQGALDRRLDPSSRRPLALGFSGGGDSLALMVLTVAWAAKAGRRVLALTVDHGLHADSATWTAAATATARRLGAEARVLAWTGPKPSTGLPAAARRARHALLADAARDAGACVLLLGHTADDVAESRLIRRETPGHGGLAEWSPSPAWPQGRGVFVLRPLLADRRADLRARLAADGLRWLDDPANDDPRYARARARRALAAAPPPVCVDPSPLTRAPAISDMASGDEAAAGVIVLEKASLEAGADGAERLGKAILCASGQDRPCRAAALNRLVQALAETPSWQATLGGARLWSSGGRLSLARDLGRHAPPLAPLTAGAPYLFDGRFEIVADEDGWSVAPLAGYAARLGSEDRTRLAAIPAFARAALPVLLPACEGRPRLPRPLGGGPASALALAAGRLGAASGLIPDEAALASSLQRNAPHSVSGAPILS